jgi:TolB-like protein
MKQKLLFRLWSILTILIYSSAFAQAGQVITAADRSWAKEVMGQKTGLGTIKTPNSIAILNFINTSGQAKLNPLQKGLALMLATDLAKIEQLQVVERVKVQALLEQMELGASGVVERKNMSTIGKMLGAYYVSSGNIEKGKAQEIVINSSILDTPFEIVTRQPGVTGAMDELSKLEKRVLFNIIDQLKIPVSPEKKKELKKPLSTSTTALLALFRGVEYSDNEDYFEAAKMFKHALLADSKLKMANTFLQEQEGMGQMKTEEPLLTAPAEESGYSATTVVGVGLAVAVLGGAAVLALSGSSGSDNIDPVVVDSSPDTGSPTAIASPQAGSILSCTSGSITFSFSEVMAKTGQAILSQDGFASSQGWQDLFYVINWNHDAVFCDNLNSLEVSLNSFQDSAGNTLSGKVFSYSVGL